MPKKGQTEEQIIAALKQQEAGEKTRRRFAARRVGRAGATRAAATAGGERAAEGDCDRPHFGPADPAGRARQKVVKHCQRRTIGEVGPESVSGFGAAGGADFSDGLAPRAVAPVARCKWSGAPPCDS